MMRSGRLTLSVALATYNGEQFLQEQLDGIARQTCPPTEIVVCDDVSTDATVDILQDFQGMFPEVVRFHRNVSNLGFIKNFEQAISLCTGDIIALSDQDDVWLPGKLEKIAQVFLKSPEYGMVFTDAMVTDARLTPLGYTIYSRHGKLDLRADKTIPSLIHKTNIKGCTMAFRSKFRKYVLPISTELWGHDHWITFTMAVISRIHMVDKPLMLYRRHRRSSGNDPLLEKRIRPTVGQMYNNLSKEAYQRDYKRWLDMLGHLETLRGKGGTDFSKDSLEDGIVQTRNRVRFAEKRLLLRKKRRLSRVVQAASLLLDGEYNKYGRGARTLVKDLAA